MSKYKVGDTVYIKREIAAFSDEDEPIVKADGYGTHIIVSEEDIQTKTYEDGLADAWEAARKINKMGVDDIQSIFPEDGFEGYSVYDYYEPQEAIAKIKEWEDSKEIRRGDEVSHNNVKNATGIVLERHNDGLHVLWPPDGDRKLYSYESVMDLSKTGRNFADKLDALLTEIGGRGDVEKV